MSLSRGGPVAMVAAASVVVCAGLKLAAPLLVPFLLAGFIATATMPLVFWLQRRGLHRVLAVIVGIVVDLLVLAGMAVLTGGSIAAFSARLPVYDERLTALLAELGLWLTAHGVRISSSTFDTIADPSWVMGLAGSLLQSLAGLVSRIVLVLLIVAFMLFEATGLEEKLKNVLKSPRHVRRLKIAAHEVNRYVLVKTATSLLTGVLATIWCMYWGVDFPFLWGLLAFVLNYIPTVGSFVAAVPPVLLALVLRGPGVAIGLAIGYTVFNLLIASLLDPRLMGKALGLSPLVVFLSMVFWGFIFGPMGALLSAPLTMMVKNFMGQTVDLAWIAGLLGPLESSTAKGRRRQSNVEARTKAENAPDGGATREAGGQA